jgi:hypothetical protein
MWNLEVKVGRKKTKKNAWYKAEVIELSHANVSMLDDNSFCIQYKSGQIHHGRLIEWKDKIVFEHFRKKKVRQRRGERGGGR